MKRDKLIIILTAVALTLLVVKTAGATALRSPKEYLGFPVGADRKLADYNEVRGYFTELAAASDWIEVRDIGRSTLGKPFIMAVISTPDNLRDLDRYIEISKRLQNPRGLPADEARRLAAEGRTLVMITCNLHSTEIGSAQMALEFAYDIAAGRNETAQSALERVVLFLLPSINPDGLQMVVDWYEQWVGTEYEGCRMPWLYHHYAGHDNNRDWFMLNLTETRAVFELYFRTVVPQVILDMHQMGSTRARLFLPQFYAPANVNVDPIVYRSVGLLGYFMQLECEERGLQGVISDAYFTAYWEGTSMMTPWWHNQVGLLSELASVHVATPIYIEEGELRGHTKGQPRYEHQINFPNPWPGGWWHLRDIVDYELAIAEALLDCCAAHSERFLYNFYRMGKRAISKGKSEPPYGFVVPPGQRDPITAARMVEALMLGGVEVHEAKRDFRVGSTLYEAGSWVIRCDQPYRAYAKDLLEVQDYPDIRASKTEPFVRPYDITGWTLPFQMGIACEELNEPFATELKLLTDAPYPRISFPSGTAWGYALSPDVNMSYAAVNELLEKRYRIFRIDEAVDTDVPAGSFIIPAQKDIDISGQELCEDRHVEFIPIPEKPESALRRINEVKTALYKPWRASMDEGWTRLLFDNYKIPYTNVSNEDIKDNKIDKYDVLVIPDITPSIILTGKPKGERAYFDRPLPPDYAGGIEKEGAEHVRNFVEKGGVLICLDSSCDFAIETFGLPVRNVTKDVSVETFYSPGSILKTRFKIGHPVTYGMPERGYLFFARSPAFATSIPFGKFGRTVLANYPDKDPRASGLLIGGELLHRRAALVEMKFGQGTIYLFGFRPQHRCQTTGTFKLIFNAILESRAGSGS